MKLTKKEYLEYIHYVFETYNPNKGLRLGQYMFNTLAAMFPLISNTIRGTDVDPFYDNRKIEPFLTTISNDF